MHRVFRIIERLNQDKLLLVKKANDPEIWIDVPETFKGAYRCIESIMLKQTPSFSDASDLIEYLDRVAEFDTPSETKEMIQWLVEVWGVNYFENN
jgi:hypothetical protein